MTSLLAPLLLAAAAVIQALGRYAYHQDGITVVGQMLFPIFFAVLAVFLSRRGEKGAFGTAHLALAVAGAVLLVLTLAGWNAAIPQLYPAAWPYYAAFVLLVVEAALRIAGTPGRRRGGSSAEAPEPPRP
jgi:surface polysaccharide O-acyltransferase-like enzyme